MFVPAARRKQPLRSRKKHFQGGKVAGGVCPLLCATKVSNACALDNCVLTSVARLGMTPPL